ncbi:MAG TPA: sigma-70 family RNA polymerase sigma factor [Tepidisphaeraceae bacterium]|nr:sigma-70 family RNA polymerase sigma factor [Tepidisphaeraceae bacterium]
MAQTLPQQQRQAPAKLCTLFDGRYPSDARSAALWRRYWEHRRREDEARLFEAYAPLARIMAYRAKRGRPGFYTDELDELISDGALALLRGIQGSNEGGAPVAYLRKWISNGLRQCVIIRRGGGVRFHRLRGIVEGARRDLVQQLGHMPSDEELSERLAGVIDNPAIYRGREAHMPQVSQLVRVGDRPRSDPVDTHERDPSQRMMNREAVRLAMAGLKPEDRRILKLILAGDFPANIARKLGVSRQRIIQRLNGVLWEARSRADLAEYLGRQPQAPPAVHEKSDLPTPNRVPSLRRTA